MMPTGTGKINCSPFLTTLTYFKGSPTQPLYTTTSLEFLSVRTLSFPCAYITKRLCCNIKKTTLNSLSILKVTTSSTRRNLFDLQQEELPVQHPVQVQDVEETLLERLVVQAQVRVLQQPTQTQATFHLIIQLVQLVTQVQVAETPLLLEFSRDILPPRQILRSKSAFKSRKFLFE